MACVHVSVLESVSKSWVSARSWLAQRSQSSWPSIGGSRHLVRFYAIPFPFLRVALFYSDFFSLFKAVHVVHTINSFITMWGWHWHRCELYSVSIGIAVGAVKYPHVCICYILVRRYGASEKRAYAQFSPYYISSVQCNIYVIPFNRVRVSELWH